MTQPAQEPIETTRDIASMASELEIAEPVRYEKEIVSPTEEDNQRFEKIKEMCCWYYSIKWEKVEQPKRHKEVVMCRKMIMYLTKRYTTMALTAIGRKFNSSRPNEGLDHSTVINSIQRMEDHIATEKKTAADYKEINRRLQLLELFSKENLFKL